MSFSILSENPELNQTLLQAVNLGLITQEQAHTLCMQYQPEEIELILEQIASDQMSSGRQCIGDQCLL